MGFTFQMTKVYPGIFRSLSNGVSELQYLYYSSGIAGDVMKGFSTTKKFSTSDGWEPGSSTSISDFYPPGIYTAAGWFSFTSFCFAASGGVLRYQPPGIVLPQIITATPAIGSTVNDIFCFDSTAWIVSEAGDVYEFNQADLSCVRVFDGTTPLNAICFVDAVTGYAAGDNGLILKTTDGAITWTVEVSPTTQNLNAIAFDGTMRGIISGNNSTVLTTMDQNHWTTESII